MRCLVVIEPFLAMTHYGRPVARVSNDRELEMGFECKEKIESQS